MAAVAPVFERCAAIYVCTDDGLLHALTGEGDFLWVFATGRNRPRSGSADGPLVAGLSDARPTVLLTDKRGLLYAIDAVDGHEQWRVQLGETDLGSPAIVELPGGQGRRVLVVSEDGHIAVVAPTGVVLQEGALPKGSYVPRPLVADVDADGRQEILVATHNESIVVASPDGKVKETLSLRGNAHAGLVLADVDGNGLLELLAATDCARVYCFATRADRGWTHPRAGMALTGCAGPMAQSPLPVPVRSHRGVRVETATLGNVTEQSSFATAFARVAKHRGARYVSALVRREGAIVGSAFKPISGRGFTIPLVQTGPEDLVLEVRLHDPQGRPLHAAAETPLRPGKTRLVNLMSLDGFLEALSIHGDRFMIPDTWRLPEILGRDSWYVARFFPTQEGRYPLLQDTRWAESLVGALIPVFSCLTGSSRALFGPQHPDWALLQADKCPFFIENGTLAEQSYPREMFDAIRGAVGPRFLGFPVSGWDGGAWRVIEEPSPLESSSEYAFIKALKSAFDEVQEKRHGLTFAGQRESLFHHQALGWGAPMGYAEVADDVPLAALRFGFLRGAARQHGGKPWGAFITNSFCGARYRAVRSRVLWDPKGGGPGPCYAGGTDCGHSALLEFRLAMAAYLAGASFIQRDPDPQAEADPFSSASVAVSEGIKAWHAFAKEHPDRGIPYTPIAFVIDFHHVWRPDDEAYDQSPQDAVNRAIEAMFRHVYAWDGHRDFERGYLTNGPYGDVFDVITDDAPPEVFRTYGIVWPLGDLVFGGVHENKVVDYVKRGGIVVLDAAMAKNFSPRFTGVTFDPETGIGTQIQTALGVIPAVEAPYMYHRLATSRDTEILAWSNTGAPLLTWRSSGAGMVIVGATDRWLDERGHLLPLAPALLRVIVDAFLPVQPSADVQMLINRKGSGWVVGLINNNGISKTPTQPATTDPRDTIDCVLHFKRGIPLQFRPALGDFRWNHTVNGLYTRLPPGDVAVVEATLGQERER
jgi:hypothetical protein